MEYKNIIKTNSKLWLNNNYNVNNETILSYLNDK